MSSCAAQLFRDFVWEPCSPSTKGPAGHATIGAGVNVVVPQDPSALARRLNRLVRSRLQQRNRFNHDHHDTCMYIARSKNENLVVYTANLVDSKTGAPVASGAHGSCCSFKAADPLHAYWIKINAEHVARRRARGELEDTCELNMVERRLAYGCTATLVSKDKFVAEVLPDKASRAAASPEEMEAIDALFEEVQPCQCKFVALSTWSVWMLRLPPMVEESSAALDTDSEASRASRGAAPGSATAAGHALLGKDTVVAMVAIVDGQISVVQKVYVSSIEPKHFYQLPRVEYIDVHGTSLATGEPTYERRTN
ncbi:hypothetical protein NESM_000061800 [Novymonas esmeraldas]|uniref:DUF4833 domain-containing protein n=1 Tax=Novymonas esmeraldas TaxID=1808958 RepID=A0AAW0F4P1_9TRYP